MEQYLKFILFFAILFSIFGFIQWYVIRSYFAWLAKVVSVHAFYRFRAAGLSFVAFANILFILRFPSTEFGWYQEPLFQALVIYPGGIFFGALVIAFVLLLLAHGGSAVFSLARRLPAFLPSEMSFQWPFLTKAPTNGINRGTTHENISGTINGTTRETTHENISGTTSRTTRETTHDTGSGFGIETGSRTDLETGSGTLPAIPNGESVLESNLISRRQFLRSTGTAMITAPVAFTIGATAATAHDYQINRFRLHYPDLPSGLDGFRIVQLSDIHSGIYMTETQMRDIFRLANEQHPDLIAITGDFVDNSISEIPALHRTITDLKAEYGIFGCLGNHDHYASAPIVTSALRQQGVQMLTNTHRSLRVNGETLSLAGVDDLQSGRPNHIRMEQALRNLPDNGFRLLLSHRPDLFDNARANGIHLTLAGHTHGGQIGMDVMGIPLYPIHLFHDYAKGLYEIGRQKLYVNVGIGMVGVPVRMVRPELSVFELSRSV